MDELYGIPEMPDQDDIDYMGDAITPLQAKAEEVSQAFGFTEQLILDFLHRLYDGKLDPKQEIDAPMWEQVRTVLREAVAKGYDEPNMPDADEVFYEQLQHNTDVFAAFKVHRMQNDMAHMLLDSNGKLKTFEQWSNDVQTIASHQVGHWLQTEYDTAVIRAHQAADWQQFEREKDVLPNLKWMPSTSAHPGADHRVFWGTVRAINDPFWSSHRPGDRWNCKCSLSSTDEPITQVPDAAPSDGPQNGLENNPGVDGKAFSDSHPYFPANCASCDFYKGSKEGFTNRVKNCYNCPYANGCMNNIFNDKKEPSENYNLDKVYGKRLRIHKDASKDELDANLSAARSILSSFAKAKIDIRKHVLINGVKNPEYLINGEVADRKGILSPDGVSNGFSKALRQGCTVVVLDLDEHPDKFKYLPSKRLATKINFRHKDFEEDAIKECYVIFNGKSVKIDKNDLINMSEAKSIIYNKLEKIKSDRSHS
jgi:hypothetical protein